MAKRNRPRPMHQSEEFARIPIPTVLLDPEFRVQAFTNASRAIYDIKSTDVGRALDDVDHEAREMPLLPSREAIASGEAETEIETLRGEWFSRRVEGFNDATGFVVTFYEISRRKQLELRLSATYAVAMLLADARSLESVAPAVTRAIRESFESAICTLWLVDEVSGRLHWLHIDPAGEGLESFVARTKRLTFARGEGLPGLAWHHRELRWMDDLEARPQFIRNVEAAECHLRGGVAAPIITQNEVRGVVEVHTRQPLDRSAALVQALGTIGSQLGQFIERRIEHAALRDIATRKSAIMDAALDCIVTMDFSGRIVDFNPAAERTFGVSKDDACGALLADVIIPEHLREAHREGFQRFLKTGESRMVGDAVEVTARRADGGTFPVLLMIRQTEARDGTAFFTGYIRDITERKKWEAALEQRAQLASLSASLAVALSRESPVDDVVRECCSLIADAWGAEAVGLWLADDEGQFLNIRGSVGSSASLEDRQIRIGETMLGRVASERTARFASVSDPDWEPRDDGVVGVAVYPLLLETHVVGVLGLYLRQELTTDALKQLLPIADLIAQSVSRRATEEAVRANEARLLDNQRRLMMAMDASAVSNAKLQVLFDQSFYFAGICDLDGTLTDVNRTALIQTGYSREEVVGKLFWDAPWWSKSRDVRRTVKSAIQAAAAGESFRAEVPYWSGDGTKRTADFVVTPARNELGDVVFVLPTSVDITEQKVAESRERRQAEIDQFLSAAGATLASSLDYEETLREVTRLCVPTLADWAFVDLIDKDGEPSRVAVAHADPNHAALAGEVSKFPPRKDHLDHPPARGLYEEAGFVIPEFTDDMLRKAAQNPAHEEVMRRVAPRSFIVVPLVSRDAMWGALTLITAQSDRIYSNHDFTVARELAGRAAIAVDNARLFASARDANRAKSEFLANMSHEIRTPMTAVLGYADLLTAHESSDEHLEYLRIIKSNGNFLLDIIDDILDLSTIEAGKLELVTDSISLQALMGDVHSMMLVRAHEKGIGFSVTFDGRIPETVRSDSKRLKQILVNLIGNAIKFTEAGQVDVIVRYSEVPVDELVFDVVDTGVGIHADDIEKLFQPFARGDTSTTRSFGGTGLGLAISRRLAHMLGGEVRVTSSPGTGSTFTCRVRVTPVAGATLIRPTLNVASEGDEQAITEYQIKGRVLVVEDREDVRMLIKRLLTGAGADVTTALDGLDAVSRVSAMIDGTVPSVDLIVLDMQMPRLDGYRAAKILRDKGWRRPIVALTADAMPHDRERCLSSGCDEYITKPVKAHRLLGTVAAFLRHRSEVAQTDPSNTAPPSRIRVLIVDDSVDACHVMQQLLEMNGFDVDIAHDGRTALAVAVSFQPAVILLDIGLPDMDGYETLAHMKRIASLHDTCFVALTGYREAESRKRGSEAGFSHYLVKPAAIAELIQIIKTSKA